jgi:glucose uptake protein
VYFVFTLGALVSNFPLNYALMRRPVTGSRLSIGDYLRGGPAVHAWGVLGGLIWGTGTICSFVAAYTPMVGPATSFSLGEGNTMISAAWGVFVWKEFHGASSMVRRMLTLMFALFVFGLVSISLAPVFK